MLTRHAHRIGAVCYALWGLLHVGIMAALLALLGGEGGAAYLAFMGSNLPPETFAGNYHPVTQGVFRHHAWNLGLFGVLAAGIATLNWRNDRTGYWLNLALVSLADIGFITALLLPGYIRPADGLWGPVLWVRAAAFTTLGRLSARPSHRPRVTVRARGAAA